MQRLCVGDSVLSAIDFARKYNVVSDFGKVMDAIADKILVLSALVMLVEFGKIPAWIPAIVLTREFLVSGYRLIAVEKGGKVVAASIWGKLKTATTMVAIIVVFMDKYNFADCFNRVELGMATGEFVLNIISTLLLIVSVIATIFSGIDYLKDSKELFKDA